MNNTRSWTGSSQLIAAVGVVLFLVAVVHHGRELVALNESVGPAAAFLFDGGLALGLVYAGYWLSGTDLAPAEQRVVGRWCLAGSGLFLLVMGATFVIRLFEGRSIAEPVFPLLIAAEAGGIAGVIAGYYNARARAEAHHVRTVNDALAFVNDLIRHDLRNDLDVIKSHAGFLEAASLAETSGDPDLIVQKSDEALARLETTRAIADTLVGDTDLEPVDIVPVCAEVAAQIEDAFGVTVKTDLPEAAFVVANAGINPVVDNLIENAAEHNDADDPRITVRTETNLVRVTIRDNGPGIPDDQKQRIFKARREGLSSGGLSLVQTLVDGYGGEVWVENNEPRGSTFVVELPRADGNPD